MTDRLAEMVFAAQAIEQPPKPTPVPARQYEVMIRDLWVAVTDLHSGEQRVWLGAFSGAKR